MSPDEIIELAESDKIKSKEGLDNKLLKLRVAECSILECILYVKTIKNCSLNEAIEITLSSPAWIDRKDEFIQHQQEQWEEILSDRKDGL